RSSSPIPAATADICSAAAARSGRESMAVLLSMGASPPSDRARHRNSSARPPKNRVGGFSATGESGARRGQERGGRRREARCFHSGLQPALSETPGGSGGRKSAPGGVLCGPAAPSSKAGAGAAASGPTGAGGGGGASAAGAGSPTGPAADSGAAGRGAS